MAYFCSNILYGNNQYLYILHTIEKDLRRDREPLGDEWQWIDDARFL